MFPVVVFLISAIYSMRKWANAISAYIILCIWVYGDVRLGPLSVISCYIFFIIFLYLLKNTQKKEGFVLSKKILWFSLYMVFIDVLFCFLGTEMPLIVGLSSIKSIILILIVLNVFWNVNISESDVKYISNIVIVFVIILGFYSVFSYFTFTNYYMEYVSNFMTDNEGTKDLLEISMNDERGILHGRISGTSYSSLPFSILLSILFFYILSLKNYTNAKILMFTLILIFISLYMTGSRGSMAAVILPFSLYLMRTISLWKQIVILILIVFGFLFFSDIFSLLITDEVGGSSSEQRIGQFVGAIELVSTNLQSFLFGRGVGYTKDYLLNFGPHPLCLSFESTLVHDLVEYGVLGVVFIFIGKMVFCLHIAYVALKKYLLKKKDFYLLVASLLCYLIYNILIGGGYDSLFIISYFMMIKFYIIYNNSNLVTRQIQ